MSRAKPTVAKQKATPSTTKDLSSKSGSLLRRGLALGAIGALLYGIVWAYQANADEQPPPPPVIIGEVEAIPPEAEEPVSEKELGFFDRLTSVKDFIVKGDTSVLASHVDHDLESRYAALTQREQLVAETEIRLANEGETLDAKMAQIDNVKNCIISAIGGGS